MRPARRRSLRICTRKFPDTASRCAKSSSRVRVRPSWYFASWVIARQAYSNFCEIFMSESQQAGLLPASKNTNKLCAGKVADVQNVWENLRSEAARVAAEEPTLHHLVDDVILSRETLAGALGARLARRLAREDMPRASMEPLLTGVFEAHPQIVDS